jgi:PAS domain S-box-containing protein
VLTTGQEHTSEEVVHHGDEQRHYMVVRFALLDCDNNAYAVCSVATDMTRRIQDEMELQEKEKLYRGLIETTAAVAWEYDIESQRFSYMGPRIFELTGFSADQWTDINSWAVRIHPDDRERAIHFCQVETDKGRDHSFEYRTIAADGRVVWIRDEVTVITQQGKPVLMRGYFFDITEDKQTEEALRRAQKMDAIGQLAGGIAHDFNNILAIIIGNLALLERQITADEKVQKRIDSIKHSTERAVTLTRQLLGFSRREAVSVKATDVNKVIDNMQNLITQSLTPQVEVEYHCEKNLWQTEIDPGDFEDALLNLVLNARDAMAGRGNLTIETHNSTLDDNYCLLNPGVKAGEYVQLTVSDNGVGISKEQQAHIFEPFYTTKEQGKGTGLGLSMVFGFVERSQGHIKVYSEPGTGTTFRLYLPRSKANKQVEETKHAGREALHGGMETILIVDDEPALLELVEEMLQQLGYKVLTASNGKQALQKLADDPDIDLLFTDVVMPGGINGYELAEQAVASYPDIKVLLTSGYTEMAGTRNGQERFNAHLISKPYTRAELTNRIRERLNDTQNGKHQ